MGGRSREAATPPVSSPWGLKGKLHPGVAEVSGPAALGTNKELMDD